MPQFQTMTSLVNSPSIEYDKASGEDSISVELVKRCESVLLPSIHRLILRCWEEGRIPQDFKGARIVTVYKNKGNKSNCSNYRGISMLSATGKLFARVVLKKLQVLVDEVCPESQSGFRRDRSTIDMLFTLSLLKEKCREPNP